MCKFTSSSEGIIDLLPAVLPGMALGSRYQRMTLTPAMSVTTFPWTTSAMGRRATDKTRVYFHSCHEHVGQAQSYEPASTCVLPGSLVKGSVLCQRRSCLPSPSPNSSAVSLWNILRNNIGKDLSKVTMPVQLNEPLNTLQRLCEELEYSELLDRAADTQDPFERMVRRRQGYSGRQ